MIKNIVFWKWNAKCWILHENYFAKITKRRIRRKKPFHADTPFENGGGGVGGKSSAAAAFGGGVQAWQTTLKGFLVSDNTF